jgi:electron transport complex protein RnfG
MEVQRKMKSNTYKEYIAPVVVLVCICVCVTAALAIVYGMTKPVIDTNSKAAADATRGELLPTAEAKFVAFDGDIIKDFEKDGVRVDEVFVAENKSGMVCTCASKSFGGELTMMVGIDNQGKVTGVKVTAHSDTPGLGTKDFEDSYLKQYKGLEELNATSVKDDGQIKFISGASVSGSAVHYGVYAALAQYKAMGGVQ